MKNTIELTQSLRISQIVTGLWQVADMERETGELDPQKTAEEMIPYIKAGISSFDMADHYGSSEVIAGALKGFQLKQPVQLFTKWVPKPGKTTKATVKKAVERSLKRMKQDSIDLMQYHTWNYLDPSWIDALIYLKELKEEGYIKNIGVTNFDPQHLRIACASGIPIITNQISYSLLDRRGSDEQMKNVCKKYDVKLLAYGSLAGGFLTDKWLGKKEPEKEGLATWSEMKYKRFIDISGGWDVYQNLLKVIKQIANAHNVSIANISTKYCLQNPFVAAVIIGARLGKSEHLKDNFRMLKLKISDEDLNKINNAQNKLSTIPGNCGDEYRKPPYLTASGDLSHHVDKLPNVFKLKENIKGISTVSSNTKWEKMASYSRALKFQNRVLVSGTTATHGQILVGRQDATAQTHFILDKIEASIESLGGTLKDVIRTRVFIKNISDWERIAAVHGERFKGINPVNTMVKAGLIGEGYLVEIEAEASIKNTKPNERITKK